MAVDARCCRCSSARAVSLNVISSRVTSMVIPQGDSMAFPQVVGLHKYGSVKL